MSPLTFGVELEFALAYIMDEDAESPLPSETRILRFVPLENDIQEIERVEMEQNPKPPSHLTFEEHFLQVRKLATQQATTLAAKRHIAQTLQDNNLAVLLEPRKFCASPDTTKWEVSEDTSVKGPPDHTTFSWLGMEVKPSALYFTTESLSEVEKVCQLLTSMYLCTVNLTTGLHVHVGDSDKGFDSSTLRNLVAFCWAFEPQLDTLHPASRLGNEWAPSMRDCSSFAEDWQKKHGERPTPSTAIAHLMKMKPLLHLLQQTQKRHGARGACNFRGFINQILGASYLKNNKQTLEFRQHEGTLDPERIINWIKTVVGIVDFVRDTSSKPFLELLAVSTESEKWEKLGDGLDSKREAEMGPISAEGNFTIMDLLAHMGLWEPYEYYQNRWYKHNKEAKNHLGFCTLANGNVVRIERLPPLLTAWDYKTQSLSEPDFKKNETLRKLWESLTRVGLVFDADDPKWPSHTTDVVVEYAPFCWD
jgi:hypothetical protein